MQQVSTRRLPKESGQESEFLKWWVATPEEANRLVALDNTGQAASLPLLLNTEVISTSARHAALDAVKTGRYKLIPSKKDGKLGLGVVLFTKP